LTQLHFLAVIDSGGNKAISIVSGCIEGSNSYPSSNPLSRLSADGLAVYHPDGELFKEPGDLFAERDRAQQERDSLTR
jgi:hypothetical protein